MLGTTLKRPWLLGLSALGLALSLWLEVLHVRAYQAPDASSFCSVGAKLDCTTVALSSWSVLFGLPLPIWGALAFLAIGVAAYLRSAWVVPLAIGTAIGSVALFVIELVAIGSLCLLCEAVHLVAIALAVVAWRDRAGLVSLTDRDTASLILMPPVGLMLGALLLVPPYWKLVAWKGELPFPEGTTTDGHPWIGAKDPKLTLEEFTDYSCGHCKLASAWTLKRLAAHPKDIRIVRRQYPRMRCPPGQKSSCPMVRAAYCAGEQGRFWQMDRWLFEHGLRNMDLVTAARDVRIDFGRFATCVERADIYARAERESADAVKHRVTTTPTYMVGGKKVSKEAADRMLERGAPD